MTGLPLAINVVSLLAAYNDGHKMAIMNVITRNLFLFFILLEINFLQIYLLHYDWQVDK